VTSVLTLGTVNCGTYDERQEYLDVCFDASNEDIDDGADIGPSFKVSNAI